MCELRLDSPNDDVYHIGRPTADHASGRSVCSESPSGLETTRGEASKTTRAAERLRYRARVCRRRIASKQSRHRLELACSCAGDLYEFRLWAIHNARAGGNAPFQHTERILSGMLDRLLAFRFAHSQHIIHADIRSGRRFWSLYLTLGLIRQLWHRDGLRSLCSRKSVVWGCCSRRKWWCSHQECWLWWLCAAGTSNGRRIQPGIHTGPQTL